MDTAAALFQVVGALRQARHCDGHVLQADGVAEALQRIVPAEEATLIEHDMRHQQSELVELLDTEDPGDYPGPFWDHFPGTVACSYTEHHPRLRLEVMRTDDFYTDREWHSTGMGACRKPQRTPAIMLDFAADTGQGPQVRGKHDPDHGSVWASTDSTAGRSRTIGAQQSPASAEAYTCPPVVPK